MSVFDFAQATQDSEVFHPPTQDTLPAGNYVVKITEVTNTTSSGGYPMLKITVDNDQGRQWDNVVISPNQFSVDKLGGLFESAGVSWPPDFTKGEMDSDTGRLDDAYAYQLEGRTVGVIVRDEEDNRPEHAGEFRARVKGYVKADVLTDNTTGPLGGTQSSSPPAATPTAYSNDLAF